MLSLFRIALNSLMGPTPAVCPAKQQGGIRFFFDDFEDAVSVCLQVTIVTFQDLLRAFSSSALRLVKERHVIQRVVLDPKYPCGLRPFLSLSSILSVVFSACGMDSDVYSGPC